MSERMNERTNEWMNERTNARTRQRANERPSEQTQERKSERTSERVKRGMNIEMSEWMFDIEWLNALNELIFADLMTWERDARHAWNAWKDMKSSKRKWNTIGNHMNMTDWA